MKWKKESKELNPEGGKLYFRTSLLHGDLGEHKWRMLASGSDDDGLVIHIDFGELGDVYTPLKAIVIEAFNEAVKKEES